MELKFSHIPILGGGSDLGSFCNFNPEGVSRRFGCTALDASGDSCVWESVIRKRLCSLMFSSFGGVEIQRKFKMRQESGTADGGAGGRNGDA